jgi:parallel beta-helix repeat protein
MAINVGAAPTVAKPAECTVFVAASDARSEVKALSDYVCTGTNDDVTIEQAFAALPAAGGRVCFPPDILIIGNPEVKPICEFNVGDRVLTHIGEFKPIIKKFVRNFNGDLISIKAYGYEIKATPEHPVLAVKVKKCPYESREYCHFDSCWELKRIKKRGSKKYKCQNYKLNYKPAWIPIKELNVGDYILFPILRETKDVEEINLSDYLELTKWITYKTENGRIFSYYKNTGRKVPNSKPIPEKVKITSEFLILCGYYIADGSTAKDYVRISLGKKEEIEEVRHLFKSVFGLDTFEYKDRGRGYDVCVLSTPLVKIFRKLFGGNAKDKKIPEWMLFLPKEKQRYLIEGMVKGDGHKKGKRVHYSTISETLAFQLRTLLFRLGILNHMCTKEPKKGKIIQKHKQYYFIWYEGRKYFGYIDNNYAYLPITEVRKIPYNGLVYNLEVEGDNSYTTMIGAVHNCLSEGTFTFGSSLDILKSNVSLEGSGPGTKLFLANGANTSVIVVGNGATALSNIKISDLLIDGNKTNQTEASHGIYFYGASGYLITNSVIENVWVKNCYSCGIYLSYSNNNTVTGNNSQSNNFYGIYLSYSNNNTVTGNNSQSNNSNGIYLYYSNNNTVTGNNCQSNVGDGIYLHSSSNNTVTGNNCQSNDDGIYLYSSSNNNTITGNNSQSNAGYGIFLYSNSNNNTVIGNNFKLNNNGISLHSSFNNTITGNNSQSNSFYGIYLLGSNNNTITGNNSQSNSANGIYLHSSNNNTITGNNYQSNNYDGIYLFSSSNNTITGNILKDNSQSANNAYNDIVVSSNSNYNIISNNICIATATNKTKYAINESGSNYNIVISNYCSGQVSGKIYLTGLNSIASNNLEV